MSVSSRRLQRSLITGSIYLSPRTTTVSTGSTVDIAIMTRPRDTVDSVTVSLTYNSSIISYVSIDTSTSSFSTELLSNTSTGSIHLERGNFAPVAGTAIIAIVRFSVQSSASNVITITAGNTASEGVWTNPDLYDATIN